MFTESLSWAFSFMLANIIFLGIILHFSRKGGDQGSTPPFPNLDPGKPTDSRISLTEAMGWEFEYARVTASEAMRDRHLMLNFHIILIGVATSVLLGFYNKDQFAPKALIGTTLLWILCIIGWVYFLILIRLRKAWHDSALAMNHIKDFCVANCDFPPDYATNAFRWKTGTLPPPEKPWNVFFLTALLIAFLNSISFLAGAALIVVPDCEPVLWMWLLLFFAIFFGFHIHLYHAFLRAPTAQTQATERSPHESDG